MIKYIMKKLGFEVFVSKIGEVLFMQTKPISDFVLVLILFILKIVYGNYSVMEPGTNKFIYSFKNRKVLLIIEKF